MRALVVGANGDLGSRCCRALLADGVDVRGSVRKRERATDLVDVEIVEADLTSDSGLTEALRDVDTVLLTANPITPRRGDRPDRVEEGLLRLVEDAERAGVRRVVLPSIPETEFDDKVPFARARRRLEAQLSASTMETVVLRFPPFMDTWLALVGSSIPLRGGPHATIGRPSPFLQSFRRGTGSLVERRGVMLVPGSPKLRHSFIATDDAATEMAHATQMPAPAVDPVEIGGPEALSWKQVAAVYSSLLDRPVRIVATPAGVYRAASLALRPVAEVPSNTMALNVFMASAETAWPPGGGILAPEEMTTVRQFLEAKLLLPDELPEVV